MANLHIDASTPSTPQGEDMGTQEQRNSARHTAIHDSHCHDVDRVSDGSCQTVVLMPDHACELHTAGLDRLQEQFPQPVLNKSKHHQPASTPRR